MLVPKSHRLAIYRNLFNEGVVVAKKDFRGRKHEDISVEGETTTLPNLHVAKLMQSLKSRGYVKESFSWQFYYWYLTNEGIEYLREYLHLPAEVMPKTLQKVGPPSARWRRVPLCVGRASCLLLRLPCRLAGSSERALR
jgi:small subunit ribosomal protein S10e